MFKIVALVMLFSAGAQVGEQKLTNKMTFDTMESCVEWKGSEKAAAYRLRAGAG